MEKLKKFFCKNIVKILISIVLVFAGIFAIVRFVPGYEHGFKIMTFYFAIILAVIFKEIFYQSNLTNQMSCEEALEKE